MEPTWFLLLQSLSLITEILNWQHALALNASMGIAVDDAVELRPLGEPNTSHFSVTMQCLGVDVTSLILASGFVPLSQAFCYCAFSPNCLPPQESFVSSSRNDF